ncbi:ATP-binding protein [Kribbella sp. CA-293567]|uniref:ATP-binding protein n=1 Tax=Kribbella sp. CA-293567 TaxID=3002436 RepID=UPI0022DD736B|nr:LuxR family transcriptional regulator [Kribbella sp. CA-293567]WBQ06487.1 AAA family ATPase [Kribbella sp. CA-293567]
MTTGMLEQPAETDFVGRTTELAKLAELATKVRAGQHQTATIQGPPGIGKSGLVHRFTGELSDFTLLQATGDRSEHLLEMGVVDQLLSRVPAEIRARTPLLRAGVPPEANPIAVGSQLLGLIDELQRDRPVALVVDDIQWVDQASLQALRYLLRRVWAEHLLIVLISRSPDSSAPDPPVDHLIRGIPVDLRLEVSGLDLVDVADLARRICGRRMPATAAYRFHSYTGGHPLLLRTLLNEVFSQRFTTDNWWLAVPSSVSSAVRRSIRRLPESSRSLLEAMAVLGGHPSLSQVAKVADVRAAHEALGPAIDAGLVTWFPEEPSCPVTISHDMQREAVYASLSPVRRQTLHQRAATTVDHVLAWRHRVAAVTSTDSWLADELEEAAAAEAQQGNYGTSATFLNWAAELTADHSHRERLSLTATTHVLFSSDRGRAERQYDRANCSSPSALRSLTLGLCELYLFGERRLAEQHLAQAFELSGPSKNASWIHGAAAGGLTDISVRRGDLDEALEYAEITLRADGVPLPQRDYVSSLRAVVRSRRDSLTAGLDELRYLPDDPAEISHHDLETLGCRGAIRAMAGLVEEARDDLAEVVRRQDAGTPMLSGVLPHCYLAAVQYRLGEWDESVLTMRSASLLALGDEPVLNEAIQHLAASLVPSARGDWKIAEDLVRRATAAAHRVGGSRDLRYAAMARALLCQARNDFRGMLGALSAVPEFRSGSGVIGGVQGWWSSWWISLLVDALQSNGRITEAAHELAVLRERTHGVAFTGSTLVRLTAGQAEAEGDLRGAVDLVEEFLAGMTEPRQRLSDGMLFHAHGRRLLLRGETTRAADWLHAADRCFGELGAVPYRGRLAIDLARLQTGPPQVNRPALTAREQQVAELVVQNLSNREVAARLHVTPKTIEYHLRNIFAKLGITSRRDLARAL